MIMIMVGRNVGLNTNTTQTPNSPLNVNEVNYRANNGMNTNNVRNVGNRNFNDNNFTLSDDIANRVAGIKEVKSARVLITDHTAYVAAVLNNDEGVVFQKELKIKLPIRCVV